MKLLLDVHVAKAVVGALRKVAPTIQVEHVAHWRGGAFREADDEEILAACHEEQRVWLTYDLATVPDLLKRWMAEDRPHSGVIFADANTVRPNAPAEVASAVAALAREMKNQDTTHWMRFLRPVG